MKTQLISCILLCLLPYWQFAQRVTVSEPISLSTEISYDLIGNMQAGYLVLKNKPNSFEVVAFDTDLKQTWDRELVLDEKRPELLGVIDDRDVFNLVYSHRKDNDLHLKVHKYDPGAFLLDSATIINYGRTYYRPEFTLIRSEDRSKVGLYEVKNGQTIKAMVFDLKQMALLWQYEFQPVNFDYPEELQQLVLDDLGNMYLILSRENRKARKLVHHFEYLQFGPDTGEKLRTFKTSLKGKLTYTVLFSYDNLNKKLVGGGIYSTHNNLRGEGHYYLSVQPAQPDKYTISFDAFEDQFVNTLLRRKLNKKNKGITETSIQEIVHRRDGGILMIGERNRIFQRGVSGSRIQYNRYGGRYITDYFYDDLFVVSVHPSGETHWRNILHKKQYSQDDGAIFSSYFLLKTPTSLRMLFNDEIKYENTVSEYVLYADGDFDRNAVLNTANQKLQLRFRDAIQVASDALIVPSERRNKLQLVKVHF